MQYLVRKTSLLGHGRRLAELLEEIGDRLGGQACAVERLGAFVSRDRPVIDAARVCRGVQRRSWLRDDSVPAYLKARLQKARYVALGEFHAYGASLPSSKEIRPTAGRRTSYRDSGSVLLAARPSPARRAHMKPPRQQQCDERQYCPLNEPDTDGRQNRHVAMATSPIVAFRHIPIASQCSVAGICAKNGTCRISHTKCKNANSKNAATE